MTVRFRAAELCLTWAFHALLQWRTGHVSSVVLYCRTAEESV